MLRSLPTLLALTALGTLLSFGASAVRALSGGEDAAPASGSPAKPAPIAGEFPIPPLAAKYCSACHLTPPPWTMPRGAWPEVFEFMEVWIKERDLPFDADEYAELLAFYQEHSPEELEVIPDDYEENTLDFVRASVGLPCTDDRPRIANVNIVDLDQSGRNGVLVCDDVSGRVSWLLIEGTTWTEKHLAQLETPVKTHVFDYNGNGHLDIVVADLGFLSPTDDLIGAAYLLINQGDETFETIPLLQGVARVADIKPGDFFGNGKIDFAVAMFGWRETGGVVLLEQVTPTLFRSHEVLNLNGAMQLEVVDFDGNGLDDFVVLFSQEHEIIVLFRNQGGGVFTQEILARASHPAFGSSGFQLVDLDGDGDLDILYTNGDMMDEISLPKPYHGVRWFENVDGQFRSHELARMTGCYRAVAHDMNGNGHLDVVVTSLNFYWHENEAPSIIWLENDGEQNFTPRRIDYSPTNLATMDVGDLNGNGLPDVIVGGLHVPGPLGRHGRLHAFFQQAPGIEIELPEENEPDAEEEEGDEEEEEEEGGEVR